MQRIDYMSVADRAMNQIRKGAFLTVRDDQKLNTMTIGWGLIGFVWRKPIFMVAVRDSRYTYALIEKAADFTVSIPSDGFEKQLDFCGTQSGRNQDKFAATGLRTAPSQKVESPIIHLPGIHYECRIALRAPMQESNLIDEYKVLYPQSDYHTLYFGEIVACYSTEEPGSVVTSAGIDQLGE